MVPHWFNYDIYTMCEVEYICLGTTQISISMNSVYNLYPTLLLVFFLSTYRYLLYIKEVHLLSAIQAANIFLFLYYHHAIFDRFFPSCIYLTVLNQTVNSFHERAFLFNIPRTVPFRSSNFIYQQNLKDRKPNF